MVRNSSGKILVALSKIIPLPSSIVVLETIAARRAITFVQELGLSSSIFKGDSETSILVIKKSEAVWIGANSLLKIHHSKLISQTHYSYLKTLFHQQPKTQNSLFGS